MLVKIPTLRRSLSVLLICLALIAAYQVGFMTAPRSGGQTASINQSAVQYACTYLIFTDGTNTYGQNCDTGAIDYGGPSNLGGATGTQPETVINLAITHGGKIFIKAGNYTFTTTPINLAAAEGSGNAAAIGTTNVSNVELYGEGNSTILRGGPAITGSPQVIGVIDANGWYIHDLQIDGNSNNQRGTKFSDGIVLWNSNNSTIQQVFVHDDKGFGIDIERGVADKILYNHIVDSDANGIIVDGGSNYLIQGNTEDGSSDVGISISGTNRFSGSLPISNVICTGNTVENPSLGVSPFGSNAAIGIQIGDNGVANHITVSGNQLYGGVVGIGSLPSGGTNLDILISMNQINATTNQAIIGLATTNLSIEGNVLDNPGVTGILIGPTVADLSVSHNHISAATAVAIDIFTPKALVEDNYVEGGSTGIRATGQQTAIVGNTVSDPTYAGIVLASGSDETLVVSNYVYTSIAYHNGIYVNSKDDTLSDNRFYGGVANVGGVSISSSALGTFVTDNDIRNNTFPISDSGINTVITGNAGYNPLGNIGSAFVSSSKMILDGGGSSTPVNATTMTVWESPKIISVLISSAFTTGHTFVLQIDGTQIVSTSAPAAQIIPYIFTLQPGETFYCQYQAGKVTFVVSGQ